MSEYHILKSYIRTFSKNFKIISIKRKVYISESVLLSKVVILFYRFENVAKYAHVTYNLLEMNKIILKE